uniref:Putative lipocalin n=1 Tax=Rhipicephalus microplus TaxID=6941 RepID=A0A6G5A1I0_RHIMP
MALYIICSWLTILIAAVVPLSVSVEQQVKSTPHKRTGPWKFMTTGIIYLNMTTLNISGTKCKVAMRTQLNATARTFSQKIGINYAETWRHERVDYTQMRKNNKLVKGFTSLDKKTYEYTVYTFPYVLDECAVIKKQTNKTKRGYSNTCELWVNQKFLQMNPEKVKLCTRNFNNHCKRYNATPYDIEDCQESVGKLILIA